MKTQLLRIIAIAALALSSNFATAHETITAGPNRGRMLTKSKPPAEFLVTAERKVQITFICYRFFSDRKNCQIGGVGFFQVGPDCGRVLYPNCPAPVVALRPV
jgi:hypothetical protein